MFLGTSHSCEHPDHQRHQTQLLCVGSHKQGEAAVTELLLDLLAPFFTRVERDIIEAWAPGLESLNFYERWGSHVAARVMRQAPALSR